MRKMAILLIALMLISIGFANIVGADMLSEGTLIKMKHPCFRNAEPLAWEKNGQVYFLQECKEKGWVTIAMLSDLNKYGEIFSLGDIINVNGTIYDDTGCTPSSDTFYDYICVESVTLIRPISNATLGIIVTVDGNLTENIHLRITSSNFIREGCTDENGRWETELKPSDYYLYAPNYHTVKTISVSSTGENSITFVLKSDNAIENPDSYCNDESGDSNNNADNSEKTNNRTSGFELIILLISVVLVFFWKRRKI